MFANRVDAGRRLAERLAPFAVDPLLVVLGIPRGGVVVAAEVARSLAAPLDVVVAAKVGAPGNPEYAIGAVAPDGIVLANPEAGYSAEQVSAMAGDARGKVVRRLEEYRQLRPPATLDGRSVIVVDDGLATGLTALAAVQYLRRAGAARVILAVPVASVSAAAMLEPAVDELIALEVPRGFSAVGQFYARFDQTADAEVERILRERAASAG